MVESGGDNLTAIFSRALVDRQIFVIDVAGGDKVPRKGGPGVTTADLLVINKTDLAPFVNADLGVMDRDAKARRGDLPIAFTSLVAAGRRRRGRRLGARTAGQLASTSDDVIDGRDDRDRGRPRLRVAAPWCGGCVCEVPMLVRVVERATARR